MGKIKEQLNEQGEFDDVESNLPQNRYKYIDEMRQHLHTLNGKPLIGTSTACGIIGKDGALSWWAAELAAVEALSTDQFYPTLREEFQAAKAVQDYAKRKAAMDALQRKYPAFKAARFAHYNAKNDAADTGTDMHAELEKYVKLMIADQNGTPHLMNGYDHKAVEVFAEWSVQNVKRFLWSEAHCYSERLWVGGICDCGAEMNDEKIAVLDFKSSKDAYFGQFVQAAGYARQIQENGLLDADGNVLMNGDEHAEQGEIAALYIVPFGAADTTPRPHYDVEGRMLDFEAAVRLYKDSQLEEFNH